LLWHASYRPNPAAPERADVAPVKRLEEIGIELRDDRRIRRHQKNKSERRRDPASL